MQLTYNLIKRIAHGTPDVSNTNSFLIAYERYGKQFGLDQPHRIGQLLPQLMHESAEFRYDREIWGPTPAQQRYDTRTDLGNTPERDGDGELYKGRSPIQVTGKANYAEFTAWCRKNISASAPDFVRQPDLINTDPWEGLAVFWYWSTRNLNRYADEGNNEMITKRINGGLNGYADRLRYYTRTGLVVLGFAATQVLEFQRDARRKGWYTGNLDGDDGPLTRAAIHRALLAMTKEQDRSSDVKAAPVTETKTEVIVPPQIDKPIAQTSGLWERLGQIAGLALTGGAAFLQDWRAVIAITAALIVLAVVGIVLHKRLIDAVQNVKRAFG